MRESVVLLAGFDSGLKYAARLADAFAAAGAEPVLMAPTTVTPHQLAASQVAAVTSRPVVYAPWDDVVAGAAAADVVVPVFEGPRVQRFITAVHATGGSTLPAFGAGYIGMALNDIAGGYLMRSLADVIAVNSRQDLADFTETAEALGLPPTNLELCGLALLPGTPAPERTGPITTVLFADQPTVPGPARDRAWMWGRVASYAALHPDRTVLLRPRHRPGEDTFHRMRHSPDAWARHRELPPNMRIDHTPIHELLPRTDLLLTVSSTAALEAIAAGIRVAFVADFVSDAALNPRLLPSGLLRRFDEIDQDRVGAPRAEWLDDVFPARAAGLREPADAFAQALLAVARGERPRTHPTMWDTGFHGSRRRQAAALAALDGGPAQRRVRRLAGRLARRAMDAARS